ncbi:MAG TPA: helix-turn-helix transcriptional regulator [Trebonia sp.]|nr:helix-turn-helix transcriptional regulator [Trebonia sp.]
MSHLREQAKAKNWTIWELAHTIHAQARTATPLHAWRLTAELTQAELAAEVARHISQTGEQRIRPPSPFQIDRWESGEDQPAPAIRALLARVLRECLANAHHSPPFSRQ